MTNCKDWSSSNEQFQGGGDYIIWFKLEINLRQFSIGAMNGYLRANGVDVIDILKSRVGGLCSSLEDLVKETEVNQ